MVYSVGLKNIENCPIFYSICFAKEKSSSIFARTFAKAEWEAKPKGFCGKNLKILE
jgi:hypothetical protein